MKRILIVLAILLMTVSFIGAAPASGPSFKLTQIGHAIYVDASENGTPIASIVLPDGSKISNRNTAYWRAIDYGTYTVTVADTAGRTSTQEYTLSQTDGFCYSASLNGTGQIDTEVRLRIQTNYAEAYFRTIVPNGATIYIPNTHTDPAAMAQQEGQYSMIRISDQSTLVRFINDGYVSMRGVTESGNTTNFNMLFLFPDQVDVDLNNDGTPDLNMDNDGDGQADTNIDNNGDGVVDENPGSYKKPSELPTSSSSSSSSSNQTNNRRQQRPGQASQADPFVGFDITKAQVTTAEVDNHLPHQTSPTTPATEPTEPTESTTSDESSSKVEVVENGNEPKSEKEPDIAVVTESEFMVTFTLPTDSTMIESVRMANYLSAGKTVEVVIENPQSKATYGTQEAVPAELQEQAQAQLNDLVFYLNSREMVTGKELSDYVWNQALSMLDSFSNNPVSETEVKTNPTTGR